MDAVSRAPTDLLGKARKLKNPRSVTGQLVDFFNDEVLVQLAAAAWGLVVPIGAPSLSKHLWFKALNAAASLAFFSGLQIAVTAWSERYLRRRGFWHKGVSSFIRDALVWQPRLSWAEFALALSEEIQVIVICNTGCPTAAVLALVVLLFALLRLFGVHHKLSVAAEDKDSIWQYPLATVSLAALQFSAKIFYSGWILFSRGFEGGEGHWGERVAECLNQPYRRSPNPRQEAEQAMWSCALLFVVTTSAHRQLPKLIKVVQIENPHDGEYEQLRLEKLMWFVAFIWGVGFPDYMLIVIVEWLGADVLQSKQLGYLLMYAFSVALFIVIAVIMHRYFQRGCTRTLLLYGGDQELGAEWEDSQADPGVVRLVKVQPGSVAAGRRSSRGFGKLLGCRVLSIDGQSVCSAKDANRLIKDACSRQPDEHGVRSIDFSFTTPSDAMSTLEDALGGSAPEFLQRTLNNMSWWPFEANIRELVTSMGGDSSIWWGCMRSLTVTIIAIGITLVSVVVFALNRYCWLGYIAGFTEQVEEPILRVGMMPAARTMPALKQRWYTQSSMSIISEIDDFNWAGPRPPPKRQLPLRHLPSSDDCGPECVLRARSNVELEKSRALTIF